MQTMGKKIAIISGSPIFWCPGCNYSHKMDSRWEFNHNLDAPTFYPSLNVVWVGERDGIEVKEICHSFITNGYIKFLDDCTHELKGQTIELPDIEEYI